MDSDVFYCYVSHSYSGLCLAYSFAEGVEHAAWSVAVWLLHLLGADVDTPPNGSVHCEISENKVLDDTSSLVSWVGFHIYTFDGSDHPPVEGVYISNAIPAGRRRKTTNTHANSKKGSNIFKKHVLTTLEIPIVQRFSDNNIIKILTG